MSIPLTLVTARLTLRQFVHEDWSAMHEHYSDPECTSHTFRRTLTEGEESAGNGQYGGSLAVARVRSLRGRRIKELKPSSAQLVSGIPMIGPNRKSSGP